MQQHTLLTAAVGEQLQSEYSVHELPSECGPPSASCTASYASSSERDTVVDRALIARIEFLEAENESLKKNQRITSPHFRIELIQHDDRLVHFYTGFISFAVYLAFFDFLGEVVYHLNYWGSKAGSRTRKRVQKLNPMNQLFVLLVKLRLNLKTEDLAFRFSLSPSQISRYITTWICFLYHHLKELDWMPTVQQVAGTMPSAFKEKFPNTYAIIDASEIFIETPSDLHMQSSTWSQYKHHNTTKFLVACTPNGAICYVSPLYVGSISDVELTRSSGFLNKLQDKPGISIMADRGLTIRDILKELNIELIIPPFMQRRQQLPQEEIQEGRKIASLRIHVERAIGRIKTFNICKSTIPLSLARLSNQIVCVCAFLSNFHPALVPCSSVDDTDDCDVDEYFDNLCPETDDDSFSD